MSINAAQLPSEYAALKYIETTGEQFINTGYVPTQTLGVEAVYELRDPNARRNYIVGSCTSEGACRFQLSPMGSEVMYGWGSLAVNNTRGPSFVKKEGVRIAKLDRGIATTDGLLEATLSDSAWNGTGLPLYIFTNYSGSQPSNLSKIRLYSLKFFESGVLVRDYQPCLRIADGKAGLYDLLAPAETAFVVNGGSGADFVKGPYSRVPNGYQVRTYIESDGSQYIDTGYKPNGKTTATFKYRLLAAGQNRNYVLGYCNAASTDGIVYCRFQYSPPGQATLIGYGTETFSSVDGITKDDMDDHTVTMGPDGLVYDGKKLKDFSGIQWKGTSDYGLIVFSTHTGNATPSNLAKVRVYGLTLSEGGEVVHDYVPCVRMDDGVAGLYDLVATDGNGFHASDSTRAFGASASVPASCKISGYPFECGEVSPAYGTWEGAFDGTTQITFSAPSRVAVKYPELVEKCVGYEIRTNGVIHSVGDGTSFSLSSPVGDDMEIVWKWVDVGTVSPKYQCVITLPGVVSEDAFEDLPVCVRLSPSRIAGFSYSQLKNGQDILFRGADGMVLPHDVDTWDVEGESIVWVRVPSVGVNGAKIILDWRLSAAAAGLSAGNAWTDHVGVWHCGDYTASGTTDASGHGFSAIGTESQSTIQGNIGRCLSLSEGIYAPDFEAAFPSGDTMTVSAWIKIAKSKTKADVRFLSKFKDEGEGFATGWNMETAQIPFDGGSYFGWKVYVRNHAEYSGSQHNVESRYGDMSDWRHVTLVREGTTWAAYDNGLKNTVFTESVGVNDEKLRIGGENIQVDEVRLRHTASSADRVALEYQAMRGNYLTYGIAEKLQSNSGIIIVVR